MTTGPESADRAVELAITHAAPQSRDLEAERILANLRHKLAGVDKVPTRIARFEVLGMVGAGAMGTVYIGRDAELERDVAIKVLRQDGRSHAERISEARALARLTHPNVVTVYEVGEDRDAVFIAMELVRGNDLDTWAEATDASWKTRLEVMVAAGRGLEAAHGAGIVHGDFKPANVLIGEDVDSGPPQVRVADFGLARLEASAQAGQTTTGGQLVGTPAYMAPEQLDGQAATTSSDQFAFATSLFEVLSGRLPFEAADVESLRDVIAQNRVPTEPLANLPTWVSSAIARALSSEPADRFPSMGELLAELDRDPTRAPWLAIAAGSAAAAVAALLIYQATDDRPDPCIGGDQRMAALWGPERRSQIDVAFSATQVKRANLASQETRAFAESFTKRWALAYRDVCEATHVRGEQSDTLMDARMHCLALREGRLDALLSAMQSVESGAEMSRAVASLRDLDAIDSCLRPAGVPAEDRLPVDPELRSRSQALLSKLDRGWALYALARYRDAKEVADDTREAVEGIQSPLVRARGLHFQGAVEGRTGAPGRAETYFKSALDSAAKAGADRLSAAIWQRLLKDALFQGQHERVQEWAAFARAAAIRGDGSSATIDAIVGESHLLAGRPERAVEILEKAIVELTEEGESGRFVALVLANLGNGLFELGRYTDAETRYREGLARAESDLGAGHPSLSRYYDKLGRVALVRGEVDRAITHHRLALEIRERAFGPDDRAVATSLLGLANALRSRGDLREAKSALDRALAIRQRAYGADHLRLADVLKAQGRVAWRAGKRAAAVSKWNAALAIRKRDSPEHADVTRLQCSVRAAETGSPEQVLRCMD